MNLFAKKPLVRATLQGVHGNNPPVQLIERTVQDWLQEMRYTDPAEVEVQIECRRIPAANGFYGVRALYVPLFNPASLELRVRCKGDQYQWHCHLILPSEDEATTLLVRARPGSMTYAIRAVGAEAVSHSKDRRKLPANLGKSKEAQAKKRDTQRDRLVSQLRKRRAQHAFCAVVESEVPWTAKAPLIPIRTMYKALKSALSIENIDDRLYDMLSKELVELGIIDGVRAPRSEAFALVSSPIVPEYANAFKEREKEAQLEELKREFEATNKLLESANREVERLLEQLRKADARGEALLARSAELAAEIESVVNTP